MVIWRGGDGNDRCSSDSTKIRERFEQLPDGNILFYMMVRHIRSTVVSLKSSMKEATTEYDPLMQKMCLRREKRYP